MNNPNISLKKAALIIVPFFLFVSIVAKLSDPVDRARLFPPKAELATSTAPSAPPALPRLAVPTAEPVVIQSKVSSLPPLPSAVQSPSTNLPPSEPPVQVAQPQATPNLAQSFPVQGAPQPQSAPVAPAGGMVWVNDESKIFHRSGSRWYGKTRDGHYLSESAALSAGYREAQNGQ